MNKIYQQYISWVQKFETTGSMKDARKEVVNRRPTVCTEENIKKVEDHFKQKPFASVRQAARELGIGRESVRIILRYHLKWYPYKIQLTQQISPDTKIRRYKFAEIMLEKFESSEIDLKKIWFSDEAWFSLDGYVNKQNMRIWGSEKPTFQAPRTCNPKRVMVWCAFSLQAIIGPFFFETDFNQKSYKDMLSKYFIPIIKSKNCLDDFWFQQDGARAHRTELVFEELANNFSDRVIGLDYPEYNGRGITWPPYSPDLNPLDFFLWGYLKDRVYLGSPQTMDVLKNNIDTKVKSLQAENPEILKNVIQGFLKRLRYITSSEGEYYENNYIS